MSPDIHWHVGEGAEQETIVKATPPRRSRRSWIAILIVVLLGAGLGVVYRSLPDPAPRPTPSPSPTPRPTPTYPAVPAKLFETIDREAQALADGDTQTFFDLHVYEDTLWTQQFTSTFQAWDRPTDGQPLYSIIDFNLRTSDKAWVDIRQFRNGHSFRETRFYVWDIDRWLRSNPDPFFWKGEVETLDTTHLHVIYAVEDRELVQAEADQMEEFFTAICAQLNCAAATQPLTFTVNMNNYQQVGGNFSEDGQALLLLSPRVAGVYEGAPPPYSQRDDLPNWIGWMIAQRIAYGRMVIWPGSSGTVPDGTIMMNTIASWAINRVNHGTADEATRVNLLKSNLQPPLPLEEIWNPVSDDNWQKSYTQAFAVVYFIEQEYSHAAVPNVLKNIGQAQSFSDLIEKSLDAPFAEFDQKWQAWLQQGTNDPR